MKRKIDTISIKDVGDYLMHQVELLKNAKTKLLNDISTIENQYSNVAATQITEKYRARALNLLNPLILNYENCAKYMKNISLSYSDNLEEAKKVLNENLQNFKINGITNISTIPLNETNLTSLNLKK